MPVSEDTGLVKPEKLTVASKVVIAVAPSAAIWVLVNADISNPIPVVTVTKIKAAKLNVSKLPLSGTPNTKTDSATRPKKLTMLTPI